MPGSSLSVVVPVYNSEATLRPLVDRLLAALGGPSPALEIILVNDSSRDGSWEVIRELCARGVGVRGLDLMRNYGQHGALLAGVRAARHEVIVTIDDDLQHPPEEIGRLLAKLAEGFDVVYGVPARQQHGLLRDFASYATKLTLQKAMGAEVAGQLSAFRVFRTQVREAFADYKAGPVSIDVFLTWGTTRFAAVVVRHDARAAGVSNYTLRMLVDYALNLITGFSTLPLRISSVVGLGTMVFGLGLLVYVLGRYILYGVVVPGFAFLASATSIFAGAQLFALGILGEYLARMHFRLLGRPSYTVRRELS